MGWQELDALYEEVMRLVRETTAVCDEILAKPGRWHVLHPIASHRLTRRMRELRRRMLAARDRYMVEARTYRREWGV